MSNTDPHPGSDLNTEPPGSETLLYLDPDPSKNRHHAYLVELIIELGELGHLLHHLLLHEEGGVEGRVPHLR